MNKITNFLYLNSENIKINYLYLTILLFSTFLAISIFYDIFQIHIYRHDALYYMPNDDTYYRAKVATEGRWINYILFNVLTLISGSILSIFVLLSFGYFIFTATYKWTKNYYYSLIVSLLFIQIPSFYDLITWPATSTPAFLVLLLSVILQKRLNIFFYFVLFGILFFGTMSNYYYLLPLLYLSYLKNHNCKQNIKFVSFKLIPAWAIGFIAGYIVTQLIIYINFDHFMKIALWRGPHYIHSIHDLIENISRSINYLERDIKSIFLNSWLVLLFIFSLIVGIIDRRKYLVFIPIGLFYLIVVIHYFIVIPVGIYISPRTIVATWVGVLTIFFFVPSIKNWQIYLLTPIIVFISYRLYLDNHHNLQWYGNVTNTHFNKLLSESPKSPDKYKGVILYASYSDIKKRDALISKINNTPKGSNIEGQDGFMRWASNAWESGFKSVSNCSGEKGRNALWYSVKDLNIRCKEISTDRKTVSKKDITFYHIIGEYDGILIISFNERWNHK
ncbi:MAG: hypothetical protein GQ529_03355 [Methyloprofundus sp.]|nr:hypothetical protein [Methyloprofundus sp.]